MHKMKPHRSYVFISLCVATLCGPLSSRGATVWTGPIVTYNQPSPDPSQPANRDQLTSRVSLTRAVSAGMFNWVSETSYTHNFSPADTEWAVGSLANYATLTYTDWETCGGGNPVNNLPGQQLVAHLKTDDIYLSVKFTYLGGHFAGGFTYDRSTPPPPNQPPTVSITSPTDGASFTAPASVPIIASASDPDV